MGLFLFGWWIGDMKTNFNSWKLTFFCVTTIFIHTFSIAPPPPPPPEANCTLNFTSLQYQPPTNDCNGVQENINEWDSFPNTLCCQNALAYLSQAFALHVHNTQGTIFLEEDVWKNCSGGGYFLQQQSVPVATCGFNDIFYGSSGSQCSKLSFPTVSQTKEYQNAVEKCSNFTYAFDEACRNCTGAILDMRKDLLKQLNATGNKGEAAVISAAAGISDDRSIIDHFYRCLPTLDESASGYIKISYSLAEAVFAILIAIGTLMLIIWLIKYVTKKQLPNKPVEYIKEITTTMSGLYRFSKAEIENAINYGNQRICLGRGSAGQVYRGVLPSGQVVAIKHIYKSNKSDSFTREVEGFSRIRHPNLVCLFGCCTEDGEQYLVYEYCSAGNLAQHLLRKDAVLTWERRVKILRDCALALRYLHHNVDGCIVHRDFKLTNILLTEKLEAKLSDFGLAKMLGMEESKVFTDVRGTIGYMDPEYMTNAKLTCASDVYSFGIVALQLLSGQKVIELDRAAGDQLTRKAKDVNMGMRPLLDFEDQRLNGNFNKGDFESILQIAVLCVAKSSKGRPTIGVVFDEMDKAWKNTDMRGKQEMSSSATPLSRSLEVIPV